MSGNLLWKGLLTRLILCSGLYLLREQYFGSGGIQFLYINAILVKLCSCKFVDNY